MSMPTSVDTPRRRDREAGFTLLELMITLAISVFALMGTLALHNSLAQANTRAGQTQEAVAVGSRVMETLRKKRPEELPVEVTGSTAAAPFSNATYTTILGRNGVSYAVGVSVSAPTNATWLMRVEVSWDDDNTGETTTLPLELIRGQKEAL